MIPEKDKLYEISYESNEPEGDLNYKGTGKCLGKANKVDENNGVLYEFEVPDNVLWGYFTEEDIIREVN